MEWLKKKKKSYYEVKSMEIGQLHAGKEGGTARHQQAEAAMTGKLLIPHGL